jgi:hypothetical protein
MRSPTANTFTRSLDLSERFLSAIVEWILSLTFAKAPIPSFWHVLQFSERPHPADGDQHRNNSNKRSADPKTMLEFGTINDSPTTPRCKQKS